MLVHTMLYNILHKIRIQEIIYLVAYFNSRCLDRVRVVKNSNYSKTFEICNLYKLFWIKQLEREKCLALSDKHNFHNKFNRWRHVWTEHLRKSTIGNWFVFFYVFPFLLSGGGLFYTIHKASDAGQTRSRLANCCR